MKFDIKEAEQHLRKWQKILRLSEWDIKIKMVENEWRKTGDIKIDHGCRKAILMLNNFNPYQTNLEGVIIHELLHLKLWGMDQMIENLLIGTFGQDENDPKFNFAYDQFMVLLESTVHDLTKGYLTLEGKDKNSTYGKLEKEVEEEMKKKRR